MATQPRTRTTEQQSVPQPPPSERVAPWEVDPTLPEVTFSYHQSERGRWFCDRSVTLRGIDPLTDEGARMSFEILDRVDQIAREHMAYLYAKDAEEREKWLASREAQGYGNDWNPRR